MGKAQEIGDKTIFSFNIVIGPNLDEKNWDRKSDVFSSNLQKTVS